MVVIAFLAFLAFWFYAGNTRRTPNWRAAFIQAMIMWWAYMVFATELLSAFKAITWLGLTITWSLVIAAFVVWFITWFRKGSVFRFPLVYHPPSKAVARWDLVLFLILLIPLIIGLIAPPNSKEAMSFGMTRVAHWAQNRSLEHFATQDENLNSAPPGIGIGLLNMYVLSGSDRWCNFIPWFAFLGCIQAIIAIAEMLGASGEGSRFAALFGATMPTALALASGCLDDLPATLWVVSYVMMVYFFDKDTNYKFNVILAGFAAGLAFLTKPVTLLLLIPFSIYLYSLQIGKIRFWKIFKRLLASLGILVLLISGFVHRNYQTYGSAIQVSAYFNTLNEEYSWRVTVSNIVRNFALETDLPFARADFWLTQLVFSIHNKLGLDVNDPRITDGGNFTISRLNTSEISSASPLHTILIIAMLIAVIVTFFKLKDERTKTVSIYVALLSISLLLFNIFLKWQSTGMRWLLPYYFLFAPVIGYELCYLEKHQVHWGSIIGVLLIIGAIPWLISVEERPLIPIKKLTGNPSILVSTREKMYFNTQPEDYDLYITAGRYIAQLPKKQFVALSLKKPIMEYPLWAVLNPIRHKVRIENLQADGESRVYINEGLVPGAILSDTCTEGSQGPDYKMLKKSSIGTCFYIEDN